MKLEKKVLVPIKEAEYSKWSSGIKGGGAGLNVKILTKNTETSETLEAIYFRGKYGKFKYSEPNIFMAFIQTKKPEETNLDNINYEPKKDSQKVEKNKQIDFPFELNANEAVIACTIKNKKRYFKVLLNKVDVGFPR